MYCGNCLRDNALVAAFRALGHEVTMVPLYLPLTLDEPDQTAGSPIFFSGINVYLEQTLPWFRRAPAWLNKLMASPRLLKWAAGRAAKTRPADVAELTLSMLRGEQGNQQRELEILLGWLKTQPQPDVICLSNALLVGMARRLRQELRAPVVCMLQGEDLFLDALPEKFREACWQTVAERVAELDGIVAPSRYFAGQMASRLGLPAGRVSVVHNGINLAGYQRGPGGEAGSGSPVLGYFARMCREKGLPMLVEAYIRLRQAGRVPGLKLRVGGSCGPADQPVVNELRARLSTAGFATETEFCPNLDRDAKIRFLSSLSVFSVPAQYGEAFGLYVLEALAAGVPVVQPDNAAFPELLETTGGGLTCSAGDPQALADALEQLLTNPGRARILGEKGRQAVFGNFSAEAMARRLETVLKGVVRK
jgi:glycosyltransferase involved in cell wall biosynthesis